ncbi:hypothetical protein AVEN_154921-1 [Araneus ventricosus]|uniref:Uncharacterized protein n=1 Tax=Araneus ventricosus TaxID=182803 RepID=A0A4Y2A6Y6_ARAVE|nr:hypothetical protein AVEN_154921-1 [Araneus ventricosus]
MLLRDSQQRKKISLSRESLVREPPGYLNPFGEDIKAGFHFISASLLSAAGGNEHVPSFSYGDDQEIFFEDFLFCPSLYFGNLLQGRIECLLFR